MHGGGVAATAESGGGDKSAGAAGAAAALTAAAEEADPDNLAPSNGFKVKLVMQCNESSRSSTFQVTDATLIRTRRASPATTGFALAFFWPDLSKLLLYWFARPICTAGLERGFSFQTRVESDTRRRGSQHRRTPATTCRCNGIATSWRRSWRRPSEAPEVFGVAFLKLFLRVTARETARFTNSALRDPEAV